MSDSLFSLDKLYALTDAFIQTQLPECSEYLMEGLGKIFTLGLAYREERVKKNTKKLIEELKSRIENLEEKLEAITDQSIAAKVERIIVRALIEKIDDKICFFAGVIADTILRTPLDWDEELQDEFIDIISKLSRPELIILQAMFNRPQGEAIHLSSRGQNWLNPQIVINITTLAWIDSLVRKGLVVDASIEQIQTGFSSPGSNSVKSGSSYRLSIFARSMLDYMLKVQKVKSCE